MPSSLQREEVRVDSVDVAGDLQAFVLRGGIGPMRGVFLHGLCGHGLGYLQSFQFSTARFGTLIALQGDVGCGQGVFRSWSNDVPAINQRIDAAFQAGELEPSGDVVLIGYSLGATRAEQLAARYPDRYRRLILIGSPSTPNVTILRQTSAVVLMAGQYDRKDQMRAAQRALEKAGTPAVFMQLPGATHGAMGPEAERVMGEALNFLAQYAMID